MAGKQTGATSCNKIRAVIMQQDVHFGAALTQQNKLLVACAKLMAVAVLVLEMQAMEGLVREGLVRSIGVSNFGARKLQDILSYAQIPPAVCQARRHSTFPSALPWLLPAVQAKLCCHTIQRPCCSPPF